MYMCINKIFKWLIKKIVYCFSLDEELQSRVCGNVNEIIHYKSKFLYS